MEKCPNVTSKTGKQHNYIEPFRYNTKLLRFCQVKSFQLHKGVAPLVKISNQLIDGFKRIYELEPILPVAALKIKELRKENYSYLIG